MDESSESHSGSTIPPSWTDAEQLDFYRRMYFEYLEMWGTDLHQIIVLASEGRWFDLIEYAGDALNGRDCVEEGDAEVYEIAKARVKVAEAAPELLETLQSLLTCADSTESSDYVVIRVARPAFKALERLATRAEGRDAS